MKKRPARHLPDGTVHVWVAAFASSAGGGAPGWIARVLAQYMPAGAAPRIVRAARGRPTLLNGQRLDFNVANSGSRVALALARGARVGIDIERAREVPSCGALAREVFGEAAADAIGRLAEPQRSARFLALWTLLEAAVKAEGGDVSQSFARHRDAVLAACEGVRTGPLDLRPIDFGDGYTAAVALSRPIASIRVFGRGAGAAGPGPTRRRTPR